MTDAAGENGAGARLIGVRGAVFTIVGFVIGIAIFILPGQLAASAGPGIILSYTFAGIVALFTCLVAAQLGVCFPVSGAGFVSVCSMLSPLWGVILVWLMYAMVSFAIAFLGFGFADYLVDVLPGVDRTLAAALVVVVFTLLNLGGVTSTVRWQAVLVIWLLAVLGAVVASGLVRVETANLDPLLPNGLSPVLIAAVPAFFSYGGFAVLLELGGEVRDPRRTIPLSLGIAFVLVMTAYVLTSLVVVGVIPWQEYAAIGAPLAAVAEVAVGPRFSALVSLTALVAAASSINAFILSYSRYVVPMARTGFLPPLFGLDWGRPQKGVLLIGAFSLLAVVMQQAIVALASGIVVILMLSQILFALVLLRVQKRHPEMLENARFYLGRAGVRFAAFGLIATSLSFIVFSVMDDISLLGWVLVYSGFGALLYWMRRRVLAARGVDLGQEIRRLYGVGAAEV